MARCRLVIVLLLPCLVGCPPPASREILEPIPMRRAIEVVNRNTSQVSACLKANGSAKVDFTDVDGTRHRFDLRAVLLVIPPRHLYLTLQSGLGTKEGLLGSNDAEYWWHIKQDNDTYRYGTHTAAEARVDSPVAFRPDTVIEALGLNPLPVVTTGESGPVQRIADQYQELIFLTYSDDGQGLIEKEYWLDRRAPRLPHRIIHRDVIGEVLMVSSQAEYRRFGDSTLQLPHQVRIEWPQVGHQITLEVDRWELMPDRGPGHRAFVAPHELGKSFGRMIDLDAADSGW